MVDDATKAAYLPLALRLLAGESVAFPDPQPARAQGVNANGEVVAYWDDDDDYADDVGSREIEEPVAMIWPVRGMITKESQYCGPMGMEKLMERMLEADANPKVVGHLLDIDSGGGDARYMEVAAQTIRYMLEKPVVAHYNGVCASAAYYLASAADEIYASQPADVVGSIGVMMTLADMKGYYEEKGIKLHEIYASQSTLKNQDYHAAIEGSYGPLRSQVLDPYARQFIATVQEMRQQLDAEEAFQGKIYTSAEAQAIGMIDGMTRKEYAIARIFELSNLKNMSLMSRFLNDGKTDASQPAAQEPEMAQSLASIEQQLGEVAATLQSLAAATQKTAQAVQQVETKVTSLETTLDDVQTRLSHLETKPGAEPAKGAAAEDKPLIEGVGSSTEAIERDLKAAFEAGQVRIVK
jgi:ClpP class serine protease